MKIGVIGTGALGIALGNTLSLNNNVIMWTKFEDEKLELVTHMENKKFLPGVKLNDGISVTTDISQLHETEVILIAIPFVAIRDIMELKDKWYNNQVVCSTTKGVELDTLNTTTSIIIEALNTMRVCALSGPSFASEIAQNMPIHLMLGTKDNETLDVIKNIFDKTNISLHETSDMIGIEYCGAIKNALAIGSGMLKGLKAGDSTIAAYLATGEKELSCILQKFGAEPMTAYSYAGIGDLILTCSSEKSRNYTFGKLIGQGMSVKEAFEALNGKTVEGYKIIRALNGILNKDNCNSKIISILYQIIFENADRKNIII